MKPDAQITLSIMLAVSDAQAAAQWYQQALGADVLWDLGSVVGLEVLGAAFFLGAPDGWATPTTPGTITTRIEVFCDDPDGFVANAVAAGADQGRHRMRDHEMPWGMHRQGGFVDPYGHIWFAGDRSPLEAHSQGSDAVA